MESLELLVFMQRDVLGFERGHWIRACLITGRQVFKDGKEAKTPFLVYFGRGDSTSDFIGKGVIDTGCSRLLTGQNPLDKWEQMLTRRWDLSTQRIQLAKTMTFRSDNTETLETRTLAILLVGIAGVNGVLRVYVVPGGAPLLLSEEFFRHLGGHIDLGRGHLFFEKLGVRTEVESKHSPHLFLPLTSFGLQGRKVPAEIQSRISSDECSVCRATYDSSGQNKIHSWIASASDRRSPETDSTDTESQYSGENGKGRWVREHGIARRALFDPVRHTHTPHTHTTHTTHNHTHTHTPTPPPTPTPTPTHNTPTHPTHHTQWNSFWKS